jgi:two-component system cell cycle sensor histidine kinase/response regulator CckA
MDDPAQNDCTSSNRICLIVDDEPSIRKYLRAILDQEQIQCLEADSACQALGIIQRLNGRLDLIVCDIKMPGDMDGVDLAYSVRNMFPAIPVILISGYADVGAVKKATAIFELIQKPFEPEAILLAVRRVLRSLEETSSLRPSDAESV